MLMKTINEDSYLLNEIIWHIQFQAFQSLFQSFLHLPKLDENGFVCDKLNQSNYTEDQEIIDQNN